MIIISEFSRLYNKNKTKKRTGNEEREKSLGPGGLVLRERKREKRLEEFKRE